MSWMIGCSGVLKSFAVKVITSYWINYISWVTSAFCIITMDGTSSPASHVRIPRKGAESGVTLRGTESHIDRQNEFHSRKNLFYKPAH